MNALEAVPGFACAICGHAVGDRYTVREMMFGMGDAFTYVQCGRCGCLQLTNPPSNLAAYYPSDYYAFVPPVVRTGVRGALRRSRNMATFGVGNRVGRLLCGIAPYPTYGAADWFVRSRAGPSSRILDVGCGVGTLLCDLSAAGFRSLLGVDPLIPHDIRYAPGLQIRKAYLDELSGEWDVIMLHHTLEHISEQLQTLRDVASRLAPDGTCLIRIPTVSSWAWQHYREHWAQVDAPRHLFVHSVESITKIAGDAGLRLDAVVYDSTDWQFAASELYLSGRPLSALAKAYSPAELRRFRARARLLNAQGQGDQAAFYFSRSN